MFHAGGGHGLGPSALGNMFIRLMDSFILFLNPGGVA
jgi:hypothetical protein